MRLNDGDRDSTHNEDVIYEMMSLVEKVRDKLEDLQVEEYDDDAYEEIEQIEKTISKLHRQIEELCL